MADKRPAEERDWILVAQIHGTAKRHAQWRELNEDEHAAAVGELRELAAGRADLLAHVAGIMEGFSESQLDEPLARQAAQLCRAAGADPDLIPAWSEEGRRRRAAASMSPPSGGLRGGGVRPRNRGPPVLVRARQTGAAQRPQVRRDKDPVGYSSAGADRQLTDKS